MRIWTGSRLGAQSSAMVVGAAAAVLLLGVPGSSGPVGLAGGSLPLKGDELVAGDGAAPEQYTTGTGSHWNVLNFGPGVLAAIPTSFGQNTVDATGRTVKQIFVSTGANADVASAASVTNMSKSDDSGLSFLTTQRNYPVSALNMVRLPNGSLLAIDFIPAWADTAHTAINLLEHTSTDGGVTWRARKARVTMPADKVLGPMSNGMRVHRRPLVLADGTVVVPAYTVFKGSSRQQSIFLQSTDAGHSWSLRSVVPATGTPGTNEVGWSFTADGRLTAVMRTVDTPEAHLVQSFSSDEGRTWSDATPLLGPDGQNVHGIFPDLVLQPNGTLLLTTGRPDVRVLASYDGTGRAWDTQTTLFANYPSTGNNGRYDGSSGNNSLENVGANRSIEFYDQCHVWGCGAYNEQMGVSAQYVSVLTPGVGRIDLAGKVLDGTATITGTFAKPDKRFPEMRPQGAVDGSAAPEAEARLAAKKGAVPSMVVKLDRVYDLNKIGLMLGHGQPASATVSLSRDGVSWSAPVVTAADRRDYAMKYTAFAAQPARYIKVSGRAGVTTAVTELEAYSADVDTFENENPYAVPRGWTDASHAWVTDVPANVAYTEFGGYHSATALRLWDKWTDANAHITRPVAPTAHLTASMQWGVSDGRARFTVGVEGVHDGKKVTPWQFAIVAGATATTPQTVQVFDGTTWTVLGSLRAVVPNRTYVPLTVSATATTATLTLDGQSFTTDVGPAAAESLTGLTVTTGDPSAYGGIYFLDDVQITG